MSFARHFSRATPFAMSPWFTHAVRTPSPAASSSQISQGLPSSAQLGNAAMISAPLKPWLFRRRT